MEFFIGGTAGYFTVAWTLLSVSSRNLPPSLQAMPPTFKCVEPEQDARYNRSPEGVLIRIFLFSKPQLLLAQLTNILHLPRDIETPGIH